MTTQDCSKECPTTEVRSGDAYLSHGCPLLDTARYKEITHGLERYIGRTLREHPPKSSSEVPTAKVRNSETRKILVRAPQALVQVSVRDEEELGVRLQRLRWRRCGEVGWQRLERRAYQEGVERGDEGGDSAKGGAKWSE